MPNTRSKRPTAKPVIVPVVEPEPVADPIVVLDTGTPPRIHYTEEEPVSAPVFKPVYLNVKALGWYNNGTLIDKPWMPGETRKITRELYKRLKQDLPDNWESV